MSSLVESRRDSDAVADCSTRSSTSTMSGGLHGRVPRSLAGGTVAGQGSRAGCRRVETLSTTVMDDDDSKGATHQHGPLSSCYKDASSRLSREKQTEDDEGGTDVRLATCGPDNVVDVELQTGSTDSGSRNQPATNYGEVRSRSADLESYTVEEKCVDDDRRSRDDCCLPTRGRVGVARGSWNYGSHQRDIVIDRKASERTVKVRCRPDVGGSSQRCNGNDDYNSADGWNLTPKPESKETCRNMDTSPWSGIHCGQAGVNLEACVDECQTNRSEDDADCVSSPHFRPSNTAAPSLSGESPDHVMPTYNTGTPHTSYGDAGISDVVSASIATGSRINAVNSIVLLPSVCTAL